MEGTMLNCNILCLRTAYRKCDTSKHRASVTMPGIALSNVEDMFPVLFSIENRLTAAYYKVVLESEVLSWINRNILWDFVGL